MKRAVEYKGGRCAKCGYDKCMDALDFHHLNASDKSFGIAANLTRKWEDLQTELDKCVLLCANCHRELHCSTEFVEKQPLTETT